MNKRIQLTHPQGKKLGSIDAGKYALMKTALLASLKKKGGITHTELLKKVEQFILDRKKPFSGSLEWYLESVKLDLEASGLILRIKEGGKLLFMKK